MDMTRSQFLRFFIGAGAGALGLGALASCDGGGSKTPDAPTGTGDAPKPVDAAIDAKPIDAPMAMGNCMQNGTTTVIGTNHGHAFQMGVPKEDVAAGVNKTYDIQGVSGHPHTVTITGPMFAMLQQNMQVIVASSTDGTPAHSHMVTIRCA